MSKKQSYIHEILPGRYDLVSLVESNPDYFPFLLETTALASGSSKGFDILFASPQQKLIKHSDNTVTLDGKKTSNSDFLDKLDKVSTESGYERIQGLPFTGGWFVYLGYELTKEIEPGVRFNAPETNEATAFAVRIPSTVIYEHAKNQTHIVVESEFENESLKIKAALLNCRQKSKDKKKNLINKLDEEEANIYKKAVKKILDYIREGDVFQVNLSRQWRASLNAGVSDVDVYRQLRMSNPAPYSALIKFQGYSILSSSPERLFCTHGGRIETRPIAGTRPRGETSNNDAQLLDELITHPKERAEHIMLIDLERNDLGRICQPGSIVVDEFMVLESYAHVHHIVSNVSGNLTPGTTPGDIIKAVFPGGTITGCPKVRCMEIISELEHASRGAYTGSLGYLNHNGDMDMNILIRSILIENNNLVFRAGAGIVADSDPDRELEETRAKAKGIIQALQG